MNSKERVIRAIEFNTPDRVPISSFHFKTDKLPDLKKLKKYKSDMAMTSFMPNNTIIDEMNHYDEWGCKWCTPTLVGEVVEHPLSDWDMLKDLKVPDYFTKKNFKFIKLCRRIFSGKFLMGYLPDMYFNRLFHLRGFQNLFCDFIEERENVEKLLDIVTDHTIRLIDKYAEFKVDGVLLCDDFGLQNSLMISPEMFRDIFKPRFKAMVDATHMNGMKYILHSCGCIIDIIDDLIEIGVDCMQLDQLDIMGMDNLAERFAGRIAFFNCVDIQSVMPRNDHKEIYEYGCRMVKAFSSEKGGFIGKVYPQLQDIEVTVDSAIVSLNAFMGKSIDGK